MANYTTTITNEGAALLASVIANQGTLTFNEFRFSENDYTGQESTLTEVTFLGVFITASAAASVIDLTTIKASAQFNNSTITGNHNLYSLGIVGTDGNTTALIAVCTTTDPDVIREPLTGTSTYAFNVNLSVSDTSQINVFGTTAAVLYDVDVIDTLISTATNKPLSANQGRLVADNLAANENVYGAKNLSNQTFTSQTIDVVSHTPNADGSLTVTTNGAATSTVVASVISTLFTVEKGTYLFTFEKDSDEPTTSPYSIIARDSSNTYVCGSTGTKAQRTVTFAQDTTIHYECYCGANKVVSDVTFYPMIRDDRIIDPTFVPYAKTNKQLTADKAERSDLATLNLTGTTNTTGAQIDAGTFFYLNGQFCKALTNIAVNATFTENTNYKKDTVDGAIADLHKNQIAYNTSIDISSYTSTSNAFEVPADGYVILNAQTTPSGSSSLTIYGSEISSSTNFVVSLISPTGNYQGTCAFVRKGMHVVCANLQAGHAAYYDPLT